LLLAMTRSDTSTFLASIFLKCKIKDWITHDLEEYFQR
jgi:hypothetical protein